MTPTNTRSATAARRERRAHIEHLEAALQAAFSLLREKDRQLQKAQHDRDRYRERLKKVIKIPLDE